MGIFGNNFTFWKSAADQQREQEQYRRWAFPFGEKQQENLKSLFTAVFSKNDSFTMFIFLSCKEMYEKALSDYGSHDAAIEALVDTRRKEKQQIIRQLKRDELYKYLAIVVADKDVDEKGEYPSVEYIIESAQEIGKLVQRSRNN